MRLSDLSIRNPVFAVILAAGLLVFGYLGYRDLGVSQFPELDFPVVSVTTNYDSASPEVMDHDVTDVIEDAVSQVEGIDYVQSQSSYGVSQVTVYFRLSKNVDVAMQDVRNAVAAAMDKLPTDIDPPGISKVNFNKFPVIWLGVHGHKSLKELNEFVDTKMKQEIQTVPGCGGVMFGGSRQRTMRVWLDRDKLRARNLDAFDAFQAVKDQHVELPAGYLDGRFRESDVRTLGEARHADEFENMTVTATDGKIVRMKDIATIEDGLADKRSFARFNRMPTVGVGVMRATGANVVEVCDEVKRRLPALRKLAEPYGIDVSISTDFSLFIKDDIEEVKEALILGIILTAGVTFLFLGSLGTTANVCLAIPTSLIGTFVAIHALGFTVNFMTLLALSLSVGVVVDDAILVLENIHRRMELGEDRVTASIKGAREISFAALAATLSIVAIFLPIAFMEGAIGQFFYQFGITVTVAVLLSLVIALTLTPMLCSLFLHVHPKASGGRKPPVSTANRNSAGEAVTESSVLKAGITEDAGSPRPGKQGAHGPRSPLSLLLWPIRFLEGYVLYPVLVWPTNKLFDLTAFLYAKLLAWSLRHPLPWILFGILVAGSAAIFVTGVDKPFGNEKYTIKPIGRELVPSEDQNRFVINVICPISTSVDYVEEMMMKCEAIVSHLKDPADDKDIVLTLFCTISFRPGSLITEGTMFVRLVPADERSVTQNDVIAEVRRKLSGVAGMRAVVLDLSTQGFTPTRGFPVNFAVQGPDFETTTKLSEAVRRRMIDSGIVTDVNTDYRPGMQEVQIIPDRARASERNVSMKRLAFVLAVGTGGFRDGRFTAEPDLANTIHFERSVSRRYDVRLRYEESQRSSPDDVLDDFVKSEDGKLIPLRDVTRVEVISTLPALQRYNHQRKVELTANMGPGVSQGEALSRCLQIAEATRDEMGLAENYRFVVLGNASAMNQTIASLSKCLVLGFVFAYMILAAQFKSYVHPFTVLLAVPFGITGALATLWWFGDSLNMMSMIGLVLLAGLVKKNSIVLVDYANQVRKRKHMTPEEAMNEAGRTRLRPILMTSIATAVGAIPLAIGLSAGSETRAPLARGIIGGSILATAVTLIVVPVFYCTFERVLTWLARQAKA